MDDRITKVSELRELVSSFVDEREWRQFHSAKNLSMSIAIEAAELMELFQWTNEEVTDDEHMARAREELADVTIYCLAMANVLDIDLSRAIRDKVQANARKYPAGIYKGRYK